SEKPVSNMFDLSPEPVPTFTREVEHWANTYIQKFYNYPPRPSLNPHEAIFMLRAFSSSSDKTERDILECILHKLLESYRFFPEYRDRNLCIAAQIFGGMVEHHIITHKKLDIVLQQILQSLNQHINSNMFWFGVTVLNGFKTKIKEYPEFCRQMIRIPHFFRLPAHLIE
ncbi:unnamed protein product, partial [Candidula unifasciata]